MLEYKKEKKRGGRKIKFRAWDGEKMHYGEEATPFHDSEGCFPNEIIEVLKNNYNWKWMQYTGLKDKNRKEIYEGDILNFVSNPFDKIPKVVEWNNEYNGYKVLVDAEENGCLEVIGNIYENKDLLK